MGETLILASASTARAHLLTASGIAASIEPASIDEDSVKQSFRAAGSAAIDCALALAEAKAREVSARHPDALVIGADQILCAGGVWYDKPVGRGEARIHLQRLRGRAHELATAACVVCAGARLWQATSLPRLTMRRFSDGFLDDYLAAEGDAVLGSVGAYRLEGRGAQLFSQVDGDHFAILGLPLLELLAFLRDRAAVAS